VWLCVCVCGNGGEGAPPCNSSTYLISEISAISCSSILTPTLQTSLTSGNPISLSLSLSLSLSNRWSYHFARFDSTFLQSNASFLLLQETFFFLFWFDLSNYFVCFCSCWRSLFFRSMKFCFVLFIQLAFLFLVSFCILVFCRSLRENNSFKVKNIRFGRKHTLRIPRYCGYVQPNKGDD
jgi:hypothetical protein